MPPSSLSLLSLCCLKGRSKNVILKLKVFDTSMLSLSLSLSLFQESLLPLFHAQRGSMFHSRKPSKRTQRKVFTISALTHSLLSFSAFLILKIFHFSSQSFSLSLIAPFLSLYICLSVCTFFLFISLYLLYLISLYVCSSSYYIFLLYHHLYKYLLSLCICFPL